MTLSNTRFMTPKDWKSALIEPPGYGNHTRQLGGYVRRDGTAGKPLHPAGAGVFEERLRLQHQEARDRFEGLSLRRFHVHMPLLTVAKRQLNPLYTFLKAPLRLASTSVTVVLIDRQKVVTADMGFYYNHKVLPTLRQRLEGANFKGLIANLGYCMTESLIAGGYPWSHNNRYPRFPVPPVPAYLGFYYFRPPGSSDGLSTFQGAHPAAVGIKQSGEIKIIPRLEIDHYRVTLGGKTFVIRTVNSSDASADVIAFTPQMPIPAGHPSIQDWQRYAPEIPLSDRLNIFIANQGRGNTPVETVIDIWPDRAPLPSYGAVLSFDRIFFARHFGESAIQHLRGQKSAIVPIGGTDFNAYRQIMGGLVPVVVNEKHLYSGNAREQVEQNLQHYGNAASPLGRCARESDNFDIFIREPTGVFLETQDKIGWILFDGRHELSIGASVFDVAHILGMLQHEGVFGQPVQNALFIDGGSAMKVYAVQCDGQTARLEVLNRVAAGARNGPGEDRNGLNLYAALDIELS